MKFLFKITSLFTAITLIVNIIAYLFPQDNNAGLNWEDNTICVFAPKSGYVGYPRMFELNEGTLICGFDYNGNIAAVKSSDGGETWTENAVQVASIPGLTLANASFCYLEDSLLCSYRATGYRDGKFYASLRVSESLDNGETWHYHSTIIETLQNDNNFNGVWEPHFGYADRKLLAYYSNDSLTDAVKEGYYQNIEYKIWNGTDWGEKHIASNGEKTNSRDGMPVWLQLSSGKYVMTIESTAFRDSKLFKRSFVIQMLTSNNGLEWSKPKTIYIPSKINGGKYAGAPYVIELPDGRLCVSFQTDELVENSNDSTWTARVITTKKPYTGYADTLSFTKPYAPFGTDDGTSDWNGMLVHKNHLLVFTTKNDSQGNRILLRRADL